MCTFSSLFFFCSFKRQHARQVHTVENFSFSLHACVPVPILRPLFWFWFPVALPHMVNWPKATRENSMRASVQSSVYRPPRKTSSSNALLHSPGVCEGTKTGRYQSDEQTPGRRLRHVSGWCIAAPCDTSNGHFAKLRALACISSKVKLAKEVRWMQGCYPFWRVHRIDVLIMGENIGEGNFAQYGTFKYCWGYTNVLYCWGLRRKWKPLHTKPFWTKCSELRV